MESAMVGAVGMPQVVTDVDIYVLVGIFVVVQGEYPTVTPLLLLLHRFKSL